MALPSSPPSLLDELPTSPFLLPVYPSTRKRPAAGLVCNEVQLSDYGSLSSDPIFSEDTESEDAAEQPRKKRLVRGPWWNHGSRVTDTGSFRRRMAKKEPLRNADSGVWMGSDASDDSMEMSYRCMQDLDVRDGPPKAGQVAQALTKEETYTAEYILRCVDEGRETVDLSRQGLTKLSNTIIRPLKQFIRSSHNDLTRPPSPESFGTLTPSIQMYLYGNNLASLPSELWNLNITVLSLRNNELDELPPAISQLRSLKELNVAGNNLQWLPWEMLQLLQDDGPLKTLTLRPNPFIDGNLTVPEPTSTYGPILNRSVWTELPPENLSDIYGSLEIRLHAALRLRIDPYLNALEARRLANDNEAEMRRLRRALSTAYNITYLASSAVSYFHLDGSLLDSQRDKCPTETGYPLVLQQMCQSLPEPSITAVPSLFELALRSAQKCSDLRDWENILPHDAPPAAKKGLATALRVKDEGEQKCSVCRRSYVLARTEWIEYWHCVQGWDATITRDSVVPFMRRACSWACAHGAQGINPGYT